MYFLLMSELALHCYIIIILYIYIYIYINPLTDDLAVDWVNDKLYWTEATHSEISVMDITTRQTTKLIVNYDGSTTRAISVDPTTRYITHYSRAPLISPMIY